MNNPLVYAFFVGRALAEAFNEQVEKSLTQALSDLGKFDAEQRERLRNFTTQVMERANQEAQAATSYRSTEAGSSPLDISNSDLQAVIDELRAEMAQVRVQLQRYRTNSSSN